MNETERIPLDSDLLNSFVRIADCGNLTRAADSLGRTQSAISVQLRKLEDGLGAKLFLRSAKGMVLTAEGEALLPRARAILTSLRDAARLVQKPLTGSIRVGLPDDFDDTILERILAGFSRAHPAVQVLAKSGCTAGYHDQIKDGTLDVAVLSRLEPGAGDALETEPIVWAGRKGKEWPVEDAAPLAILDRPCHWRDLPIKALNATGRANRIAFQSSSFPSLQAALRAGGCVGILPQSCIAGDLCVLTADDGFPDLPVTYRSIVQSPHAPEHLSGAMAQAIRAACLA